MSKESFDPDFQKGIIASFLEKDLAEGCDCLKAEYFDDEITGEIAEFVRDFYLKEKEAPKKTVLFHLVRENGIAPGRKFSEYAEVIEEIYEKVGSNGTFFRSKAQEFVHTKVIAQGIRESYMLLEQGEVEESLERIRKVISGNGHLKEIAHDFFEQIDERAQRYFDAKQGKGSEGRIPTGFSVLDERIQGGLGSGETGVILAPPKHGKTTALVSFAVQALFRKFRVLYVTLELSQKVISAKFDSHLFGKTLDEIKKKPKSFAEKMYQIREELRGSNLHIAEFPTKGLSLNKLQGLIEKIRPDVVFVDYAALLRGRAKEERRHELTDIHEGLRGVASACKVPIWTAHQANRPSLARREIGMESIAEDFNIAGIVDVAISINQSESEQRMGTLRFFILGNRLGSSGDVIECECKWAHSIIRPAII